MDYIVLSKRNSHYSGVRAGSSNHDELSTGTALSVKAKRVEEGGADVRNGADIARDKGIGNVGARNVRGERCGFERCMMIALRRRNWMGLDAEQLS